MSVLLREVAERSSEMKMEVRDERGGQGEDQRGTRAKSVPRCDCRCCMSMSRSENQSKIRNIAPATITTARMLKT